MAGKTPYHHGIVVSDVAAMRDALAVLGFEAAPASPSAINEQLANGAPPVALVHPVSGQRIDLLPGDPGTARPSPTPAQGDTTIGIPVQGDPAELYAKMRTAAPSLSFSEPEDAGREKGIVVTIDAQRLILTTKREPFTIVHYNAEAWPEAERFYEDVLGFCYFPLPNRGDVVRTRLENAGGRVDIEVSSETPVLDMPDRRYAGASSFRLANAKLRQASKHFPSDGKAHWLRKPEHGTAEVLGPFGELMDLLQNEREDGA